MTDIALIAKGLSKASGAIITLRHDQFHPPCWQIWDGPGERLIAAFASRSLLDAAMPAVREYLERNPK